jgi:hypothetical protein
LDVSGKTVIPVRTGTRDIKWKTQNPAFFGNAGSNPSPSQSVKGGGPSREERPDAGMTNFVKKDAQGGFKIFGETLRAI